MTFTVCMYVTACDLEKSLSFDDTVEIAISDSCVNISRLICTTFSEVWKLGFMQQK